MDFTPEQRAAIETDGDLVVAAGAGSGKTRVLVERYLRLVEQVAGLDELGHDPFAAVLAITFTEKAAREMRERVRAAVEQRARSAPAGERWLWEERRAAAEGARIGTIHSFCAELLRAHPAETGLDPRFAVLDEVEASLLIAECVDEALSEALGSEVSLTENDTPPPDVRLAPLLEELGPSELRATLAELLRHGGELRSAMRALPASSDAAQAQWQTQLAQARAEAVGELLHDVAWQAATATIIELAPVAPAADKLGAHVLSLADWLATFDAAAPDFAPVDAIDLRGGAKKLWGAAEPLAAAKAALRSLRELYRAAAELLAFAPDPEIEARAAATSLALGGLAERADAVYGRRKAALDRLDFDDLERRARALLEQHPTARARWRAELRAVLVDEFQDTNDDQRALIYALVGRAGQHTAPEAVGAPSLFVVGDGKQSIYRFRGADVGVFRRVEAEIVAWGGQRVAMNRSFRSHPPLVAWVNQISDEVFRRAGPLSAFEVPFEALLADRPAPTHTLSAELHVVDAAGTAAQRRAGEAVLLAERIDALIAGAAGPIVYDRGERAWRAPRPSDIALLFQASSAFEPFEAALRARGLPFLTTAGRGYYGRKEVQDLVHLLHALDDPSDELALVGVLRSPLFALDDAAIVALRLANRRSIWDALMENAPLAVNTPAVSFAREVLSELAASRGRTTVVELLRAALARTGYLATVSALPDGERRRVNVEKLLAAARLSGGRGLRAFSEYLELLLRVEAREGEAPLEAQGSLRLMTVHRSKGLEFPVVVLPDLGRSPPAARERWLAHRAYGLALRVRDPADEGRLSTAFLLAQRAERRAERAERDRLLYVALTRAQDYLLLSGPAQQSGGENWLSRVAAALGHAWEQGGPPAGSLGALQVFRHDQAPVMPDS